MSDRIASEQNQEQRTTQSQAGAQPAGQTHLDSQPQPADQVQQAQPISQSQQAVQSQQAAQSPGAIPQQQTQPMTQPAAQPAAQPSYFYAQPVQAGISGLAITGLVLGVIAILGSFLPIINNVAFFVGILGLVLSAVGLRQTKSGAKKGRGMAVAGIVLCILSLAITLLVQSACSAALDSMTSNGKGTVAGGSSAANAQSANGGNQGDTANMQVGQTIDMENGLSVTVNGVEGGLENYDGSTVSCITVTYVNNGSSNASFNTFDWKAEDPSGAQRSMAYYSNETNSLSSGTLSPGGTVTGNVYFDDPIVKVFYYSNVLSDKSDIAWIVG